MRTSFLFIGLIAGVVALAARPAPALADCSFDGPSSVDVNQGFTLCGPSGSGYTYDWDGPGFSSSTRCINIPGLETGSYQFTLTVFAPGRNPERCQRTVTVGSGASGSMTCEITGPTRIDAGQRAQLCAPSSGLHSIEWRGPGNFSSTARCISVGTEGTYTLSIRNVVTGYTRQCSAFLEVGGGGTGDFDDCAIEGPSVIAPGTTVDLCGPFGDYTWRWTGPAGFSSSSRCIETSRAGNYVLTVRNRSTGATRQCSATLTASGSGSDACAISGPGLIESGAAATLCGPSLSNTDYQWTGPNGYRAGTRCVTVRNPGLYSLTLRSRSSGYTVQCTHRLTVGYEDDDQVYGGENCPRPLGYWQQQMRTGNGRELSDSQLREIARRIDGRSSAFNWSNDLAGLRATLYPAAPLTPKKIAARQHVALLANIAAGELNVESRDGRPIMVDADTEIRFANARTVGELSALADRTLARGTGNMSRISTALQNVNTGRAIETNCQ